MKIESVFVAIPTHTGSIRHEIATALLQWSNAKNMPWKLEHVSHSEGCSLITFARDRLVAGFMASGCSHLLMIDDDMAPTWPHIARLLMKAEQHDLQMLSAACYLKRLDPILAAYFPGGLDAAPSPVEEGSTVLEVECVGAAFMLVARTVFERLQPSCPLVSSRLFSRHIAMPEGGMRSFFHHDTAEDSEDFAFCRRVRAAGIRIYLDAGNIVPHVGRAHYPVVPEGAAIFDPKIKEAAAQWRAWKARMDAPSGDAAPAAAA